MKKVFYFIFLISIISSCGTSRVKKEHNLKVIQIQAAIDSIYNVHPDSKGIMVHIESSKQKISWSGAVGYSDYQLKKEIHPSQPALIASTVKIYVSSTILRLVELGQLSIDDGIGANLTPKTSANFKKDGYDLDAIKVKHLLSHTSGIEDYVSAKNVRSYLDMIKKDKRHRWTRDEQLALTVEKGDRLGEPGEVFNYADANFLLLTEIIESVYGKPFYTAMRTLLKYDELSLKNTWFYTLEKYPGGTMDLVHQYHTSEGLNSYEIDPSFDLYGGGGIACTTEDLAKFSQSFFNGKVVENKSVRDLIYSKFPTEKNDNANYHLGLTTGEVNGLTTYGHGGFWGTVVQYVPDLEASISVYILERDKRNLRTDVLESVITVLQK